MFWPGIIAMALLHQAFFVLNTVMPDVHDVHLTCPGNNSKTQARSCHQEVVRLSKSVMAAAAPTTGPAATADTLADAGAGQGAGGVDYTDHPAANGYLAGAELAVRLNLPALADHMLELAGGKPMVVMVVLVSFK